MSRKRARVEDDGVAAPASTGPSAIEPFLEANKRWAAGFAETDSDLLAKFGTAWQEPPILYVSLWSLRTRLL